MVDDVYANRRERAAGRCRKTGADAVVCFPSRNLQYLTGYATEPSERHFLLVVPADGDPCFLVPELSAAEVYDATSVADIRTWADGDDPVAAVRDLFVDHDLLADRDLLSDRGGGGGHLLVDDTMWARFTQDLRVAAPDATWGLASEALATLRIRKDDSELAALREAATVADAVVEELRELGDDVVGRTEADLADWIDDRLAAHGGIEPAFATIVAAGENGAKPHHHPGDRAVRAGEPVVFDFGTRVDGYPSDQTRTLVFGGEPSAAYRRVHDIVREAQAAAIDAVEPGVPAETIDRAARDVIGEAGYGDAFVHRTGHGVGLDVHEEPYLVAGNDRELEPGMVFSVEPGVYLDGEFGCRIEDLIVVTHDGAERLNTTDRGWR